MNDEAVRCRQAVCYGLQLSPLSTVLEEQGTLVGYPGMIAEK
jgi:hypothetical protein